MCGSMADIQSAAAEIRRGKKKKEEEEERRTNHSMKIYMVSLFHRATINKSSAVAEMGDCGHNRHGPGRKVGDRCAPLAESWDFV